MHSTCVSSTNPISSSLRRILPMLFNVLMLGALSGSHVIQATLFTIILTPRINFRIRKLLLTCYSEGCNMVTKVTGSFFGKMGAYESERRVLYNEGYRLQSDSKMTSAMEDYLE